MVLEVIFPFHRIIYSILQVLISLPSYVGIIFSSDFDEISRFSSILDMPRLYLLSEIAQKLAAEKEKLHQPALF